MLRNHAGSDALLISYPKCGRTWHRILLGHYLAKQTGADPRQAFNNRELTEAAGLKRLAYTHNGSSPVDLLPPSHPLVASPLEWEGRDVMLLVRDPREVIVSAYHHLTSRDPRFSGPISEFARTPSMGVEKLVTAWRRWHEQRHLASRLWIFSYADLHADAGAVLRETLRFLGQEQIDEDLIGESVRFASFGNMRELENRKFFGTEEMQNRSSRPNAAKVRKGKIGAFATELPPADVAYIEQSVRNIGDPFHTLSS